MELFWHNARAYNNALHALEGENKTCIIQPTGTGKAVVIAKFIKDRPEKRHLVLAPASLIELEVQKHSGGSIFTFRTYNGILSPSKIESLTGFDFIYLDEFHRIGADIWGPVVSQIIRLNPEAKVIGTTATHIRFLDGSRDMAFELFKNNIASYISLNRAFIEGILKPPKYISAIYSIVEEYDRLINRINNSNYEDKTGIITQLKSKVIDWEKSCGIDIILKKHLPDSRRKIIVFCKNIKAMTRANDVLEPIFKEIFKTVLSLYVDSTRSKNANRRTLKLFGIEDGITKILFTVNMINEGLHGKDISTVILLRETDSPNIWYQQIGRCFSINQIEQPIIIDFVNNFRNIQHTMFKGDFESELIPPVPAISQPIIRPLETASIAIEFIDETRSIQDIFYGMENMVEYWEVFYNKAKVFYYKNGHLAVPKSEDESLQTWIRRQRMAFKAKRLSEQEIKLLNELEIDWDTDYEYRWYAAYSELKTIVDKNGSEPFHIDDAKINLWLKSQRLKHAKGKLQKKYQELLSAIVSLDKWQEKLWKEKLEQAKTYHKEHGCFDLGSRVPLMRDIRHAHKKGSLPTDVFEALKQMNFPFEVSKSWEETFGLLKEFITTNGGLLPTATNNSYLYKWIIRQRARYVQGNLKKEYVDLISSTGALGGLKGRRPD